MLKTRLLLFGIAVLFCGCGQAPQAPALRDSPIYDNPGEGLRFMAPEGWRQSVNSNLPSALKKPARLVQYQRQNASLEVLCVDETPQQPFQLQEFHAGPSMGAQGWAESEPTEEIEINGKPAQRVLYKGRVGGRSMLKEVVVFRRDKRVYSFVSLYWEQEEKTGQQARRSIHTVVWRD